jgi:hypothetical protein
VSISGARALSFSSVRNIGASSTKAASQTL